jgi:hypothetical protein
LRGEAVRLRNLGRDSEAGVNSISMSLVLHGGSVQKQVVTYSLETGYEWPVRPQKGRKRCTSSPW